MASALCVVVTCGEAPQLMQITVHPLPLEDLPHPFQFNRLFGFSHIASVVVKNHVSPQHWLKETVLSEIIWVSQPTVPNALII